MSSDFPLFERSASASEIKLDVSDTNDIKALSQYFEKSRDELQKKVDSLFAIDIEKSRISLQKEQTEISVRSNSVLSDNSSFGRPIDIHTATALRELTVSSCVHRLSEDWKRSKFLFRENDSELGYGLLTEKNGSKGLLLSVECFILKNLIINGYTDINGTVVFDSNWKNERKVLKPNDTEKKIVLYVTLSEILWRAGEEKYACVVLNSQQNCFDTGSNGPNKKSSYVADGYTERLHLYEFTDNKELKNFMKKNLLPFQKEEGCILFLYSLILSRQIEKVKVDLQGSKLLGDMEECMNSLFNLVLSGIATPFFHNGTTYYDSNGEALKTPKVGISARGEVGVLYWDSSEDNKKRTEIGSMLKTPKFPVWLAIMGRNLMAVLFNTNLDLINDWRFEQSFSIYFYAGIKKQEKEFKIKIDTRNLSENWDQKKVLKTKYPHIKFSEDETDSEITNLIMTKWPDADCNCECMKDLVSILGK